MTRSSNLTIFSVACLLVSAPLTAQNDHARKRQLSPALLGIVSDVQALAGGPQTDFGGCALQGDGTPQAPYQLVQVGGFDCALDAPSSPWRSLRPYRLDENQQPVPLCASMSPVQVVTTDRNHARLTPLYRDHITNTCAYGPACGAPVFAQPVILRQGCIDAGSCSYGSISFDARVFDVEAARCATFPYAKVTVEEVNSASGGVGNKHVFVIDRSADLEHGLYDWRRLTYHFEVTNPGCLFNVEFSLMTSGCSNTTDQMIYPGGLDVDNVTLLTIPVVDVDPSSGAIVSGCQSGQDSCPPPGFPILPNPLVSEFGVQVFAGVHDNQAAFVCPQSYCMADLNYDGLIDGQDLSAVLAYWDTLPTPTCAPRWADINGNGTVGGDDLALVLAGWGPCQL